MEKKYNNEDGVWRTIGGRKVFIRNGQSLADAMIASGKFKNLRRDYKKAKEEEKMDETNEKIANHLDNVAKVAKEVGDEKIARTNELASAYARSLIKGKQYSADEQDILDRYGEDYGYDKDKSNLENLKSQIDYMRNPNESINQTAQRLVEGGDFLIYNGDIKDWLDERGIKYNEDNFFEVYKKEMANKIEKLYNEAPQEERTTRQINNEYEELSQKMQQDDYYYKPEDDRKLKELRAEYDTQVAKGQEDVNNQFEVSELKKKALEVLPKEDIDSHGGDLYIKKTKESTELLENMKDKDSGLLTTFKDQQTGETWYEVPFANMQDDYNAKVNDISPMSEYSDTVGDGLSDAQRKVIDAVRTAYIYKDEGEMASGLKKQQEKFGKETVDEAFKYYDDNYELIKGVMSDSEGLTYNDIIAKKDYPENALKYYKNQMEELNKSGLQYRSSREYNTKAEALRKELEASKNSTNNSSKNFEITQDTYFGKQKLGEWEASSKEQAEKEFLESNPQYKDGKKGHLFFTEKRESKNSTSNVKTNNKEAYDSIMKYNKDYDSMKSKIENEVKAYDTAYKKLSAEKDKYDYGTPERQEITDKINKLSNAHYNAIKDDRDKVNEIRSIRALEKAGETVLLDKNGKTLFNPEYYKKGDNKHINLGINANTPTVVKDVEILNSVTGQLSDGIWENSPGQEKYWTNMDFEQHNNEIVFVTPKGSGKYDSYRHKWINNPFSSKTEQETKDYVANKIKQIVKVEIEDNPSIGKWDRNNQNTLQYLGNHDDVTVAEAYNLYERLKGRTPKQSKSINDTLRNSAYQKYMKEHPGSKMTLDEFLKK